ncbi:trehalose-6-phosphate hydrolase [Geomicrobium sp. JCM 19037]|uniref:alpha,alpha-phosphotrehalase n=1 Tax=Geomicrobium sp. JCM 19037 TaxID=1460634 RepID=UPI00045F1777|nr:alpha,alpha-phosphotrehalase [Geomicrobium sp. JCM 19037]GAK04861.1 trehalose-6-phosphate hydrolase [Geomicrobium sp. JCM 19037]
MNANWWKEAVVYQIYPRSFNDTTGSGTGDLNGVTKRLDYLKDLGVDVVWLTPVYKSPQHDNGYDIANYYEIDPLYGTMQDFDKLLNETHARGMKLIMDLVVNHTSTEHEWFQEAQKSKDNPYRDYYIWRDEPNNWESKFGGSAWEWHEATGQYYLHLFDKTQADLNWDNPKLREEIYRMIEFWGKKGIDGFRLDVVNLLSKGETFEDDHVGDGRRFYTDGPRIHEYIHEMSTRAFLPYGMMTVGEMSSTTLEQGVLYTRPDRQELDMIFHFHHLKVDYPNGEKWTEAPINFEQLKEIFTKWQEGMDSGGGWNAVFWSNHDQPRAGSRFGDGSPEAAKMLATAIHLLNGTPYIYQGEELGMTSPIFKTIEEYRDVESLNAYDLLIEQGVPEKEVLSILASKSRDNGRTPMQWSGEKPHAGFTNGTPWIGLADNWETINAENAINDPSSVYYHFKQLIQLRKKHPVIQSGSVRFLDHLHPALFAYERVLDDKRLVVVCNFSSEAVEVSLQIHEVLISHLPIQSIDDQKFVLPGYGAIAFFA